LLRTDGIQYPHDAVDAVALHVLIQSVLLCNLQLYRRDEFIADGHATVRLLLVPDRLRDCFVHTPPLGDPLAYPAERDVVILRRLALCFSEFHSDHSPIRLVSRCRNYTSSNLSPARPYLAI